MSRSTALAALVSFYVALIAGTLIWSGLVTQRTIYDRYVAVIDGITATAADTARAGTFYRDVLNFRQLQPGTFMLPTNKKLYIKQTAQTNPVEIIMRVRNGFEKLQQEFSTRIDILYGTNSTAASSPSRTDASASRTLGPNTDARPSISAIQSKEYGDEFVIKDFDQNRFVFYRPRHRNAIRTPESVSSAATTN